MNQSSLNSVKKEKPRLSKKKTRLSNPNVKTAEPIGPKFCVRPYMAPGKIYE